MYDSVWKSWHLLLKFCSLFSNNCLLKLTEYIFLLECYVFNKCSTTVDEVFFGDLPQVLGVNLFELGTFIITCRPLEKEAVKFTLVD